MKSQTTAIWFLLAALLGASIWALNHFFQPPPPQEMHVFSGLRPERVTSVQIIPSGAREISATRTNKTWWLEKPMTYPAQPAAIDALLDALQKLTATASISAAEMSRRKNADEEFGFDNPQFTIDVEAGEQAWHVRVGFKTAPGDGVYVRVVGATGALLTDTAWLQTLPHDATAWRNTTLVATPGLVDWLIITNGTQALELRRDPTNRLWRMVRPLQTSADNLRIVTALEQLHTAKVTQFVNDDPKADLSTYGLEPAAQDVWLGYSTNSLTAVHIGKDVPGSPGQVFAQRQDLNSVVATAKEPLAPWRGTVNDFRDPRLIELSAPPAEVDVRGENHFTLQLRSNTWTVAGEKFPVDQDLVQAFIKTLGNLRIADFVQDVVTGPGLQKYGLDNPTRTVTLRAAVGDTNSTIAQLQFGAVSTNLIYVKRATEDFVYAAALGDVSRLALPGDYYRDPHVWNFSETNVASLTVRENGKVRQMVRNGTNDWTLSGGQGVITPAAIEETVHRLGDLTSFGWVGRNFSDAQVELTTNSLSVAIELKTGEKRTVDFGKEVTVPALTSLAVVTMDGERWAFVFPPVLYPLVKEQLTISPGSP